jgi:hypothetical protein
VGAFAIKAQLKNSRNLNDDLVSFISANYSNNLPNSLLIAQAFILKYPQYGKEYGLPAINTSVEDCINTDLSNILRLKDSIKIEVNVSKVHSSLKTAQLKHIYENKAFENQKLKRE